MNQYTEAIGYFEFFFYCLNYSSASVSDSSLVPMKFSSFLRLQNYKFLNMKWQHNKRLDSKFH